MMFAKTLVLAWTRLYTAGLPVEIRLRRLAEIESDIWEFEHDPNRPRYVSVHLLLRLVLGIRQDLCWRIEQRAPRVAAQGLMLNGFPRHPVIVTSAFTCSFTVHLVAGAVLIWLAAFPFYLGPSAFANLSAESADVPAPALSESDDTESDGTAGAANADTFLTKLLRNRYPLAIQDGQLTGAGAEVLRSAIARSRFVLLGENHGTAQAPVFWGAVCGTAAPMGFRNLAIEEGPLTAAQLEAFAKHPDGLTQLRAFQKQSPDMIHISSAPAEFAMLQQCARARGHDFQLWGLIEEGIFRTPPAGQAEARRREQAMKDTFAANYQRAARTALGAPRVLLKFGALHGYRSVNPVGGTGIGNYVAELAAEHGAESLHVRLIAVTGSQPVYLQPLIDNLLPSPEWTLFDLRALRRDLATGVAVDPDLLTLIFGYDVVIMVPEGALSAGTR